MSPLQMPPSHKEFLVWQWNCRGLQRKRANLQMLTASSDQPPSIIALQEPGPHAKLGGYQSFQDPRNPYTAILVHRNVPAKRVHFDSVPIPHDMVVIYSKTPSSPRLHVLNIYSGPKEYTHTFNKLFLASQERGTKPPPHSSR